MSSIKSSYCCTCRKDAWLNVARLKLSVQPFRLRRKNGQLNSRAGVICHQPTGQLAVSLSILHKTFLMYYVGWVKENEAWLHYISNLRP